MLATCSTSRIEFLVKKAIALDPSLWLNLARYSELGPRQMSKKGNKLNCHCSAHCGKPCWAYMGFQHGHRLWYQKSGTLMPRIRQTYPRGKNISASMTSQSNMPVVAIWSRMHWSRNQLIATSVVTVKIFLEHRNQFPCHVSSTICHIPVGMRHICMYILSPCMTVIRNHGCHLVSTNFFVGTYCQSQCALQCYRCKSSIVLQHMCISSNIHGTTSSTRSRLLLSQHGGVFHQCWLLKPVTINVLRIPRICMRIRYLFVVYFGTRTTSC